MNPAGRNAEMLQTGIVLDNIWTIEGNRVHSSETNPPKSKTSSVKQLKFQIYGNLIVLSAAFLVYFVGISPLNTIQLSIIVDDGLRETTLCVHTAVMMLQALFFNTLFIDRLGVKRAILVGIALEIVFVGANMHTRWWTLIPAASVAGMGRPLMRTGALVYIARLADTYAKRFNKSDIGGIKWKFFSIYFMVCSSAGVIGTVILSLMFLDTGLDKFSLAQLKRSVSANTSDAEFLQFCGANFCDKNENSTLLIIDALHDYEATPFKHIHELCGFSLGSLLFSSLIVFIFLQPLSSMAPEDTCSKCQEDNTKSPWSHLLDTMNTWGCPKQILLIPILMYNGVDNSFFAKDFAKAFISCVFGIQITGFAIAWFGFTGLLSVFVFSLLLPKCRPISLMIAFVAHFAGLATIFNINETNYDLKKMFMLTITWGIGSGLWPFCIATFCGIVFATRPEASFSNYSLFNTMGATMNYAWSYHLCAGEKLYIILSLLIVGFAGYLAAELLLKQERKKGLKEINYFYRSKVKEQAEK